MEEKRLIAITGGIGSGKSVVSTILHIMGYPVYDCDSRAKKLMCTNINIKNDLISSFGEDCISLEGKINTQYISSIVFKDKTALLKINSIVHPRVKEDILLEYSKTKGGMFVETAILLQSNLLDIIDEVWLVDAPENVRIKRVMDRNSVTVEDVKKRINAQCGQDYSVIKNLRTIINDGDYALLPQISCLISQFDEKKL